MVEDPVRTESPRHVVPPHPLVWSPLSTRVFASGSKPFHGRPSTLGTPLPYLTVLVMPNNPRPPPD